MDHRSAPYRSNSFSNAPVLIERTADGVCLLRSSVDAPAVSTTICDFLPHWAEQQPTRIFLGERDAAGQWATLDYASAWRETAAIASALEALGIGPGDGVMILSGNSTSHALLQLAAMAIGAFVIPVSPNYALRDRSLSKLRAIANLIRPAAVFAESAHDYESALAMPEFAEAVRISANGGGGCHSLLEMRTSQPVAGPGLPRPLTPGTIAKVLFTSGSTGDPKGVINTHGMLASVLEMLGQLSPATIPPVQLEWLPWHHTMGGNAIFNGVLRAGGTLYIDDGLPTPELFGRTVANLIDVAPTSMLTVPIGLAMLTEALESNAAFGKRLFERLERITFGGAALPQDLLDRFQHQAVRATGHRIPVAAGYGLTETAPTASISNRPSESPGEIGVPIPGVTMKLVPADAAFELRIKGANVTPGYYGRPDLTAEAFDDEGFYKTGDLVEFVDPADAGSGLRFAGRVSENFKLTTGTWVNVGQLRLALLDLVGGLLSEIVIVGENRSTLAFMGWISTNAVEALVDAVPGALSIDELSAHPVLIEELQSCLARHNLRSGASLKISAFRLSTLAPRITEGEITDKGYVNQRAVVRNRSAEFDELWSDVPVEGIYKVSAIQAVVS